MTEAFLKSLSRFNSCIFQSAGGPAHSGTHRAVCGKVERRHLWQGVFFQFWQTA
jgi:hypothetical protein